MSKRNFRELLEAKWAEGKFVCVGLDSDLSKIPEAAQMSDPTNPKAFLGLDAGGTILSFNQAIIDATKSLVSAYKPNSAFYEEHGEEGWDALRLTIRYVHETASDVPVILDFKRGDIGNTNAGYVYSAFEYLGADAVTVNPYLGAEALAPFLAHPDKGVIVLCRTSNPGAGEFQDLHVPLATFKPGPRRKEFQRFEERIGDQLHTGGVPLYQYVAFRVAEHWNKHNNCAVVVGATYPEELQQVRRIVGDMPILIPGIGAQGGDVEKTVSAGKDSRGQGMIINSSRGIIFASSGNDFGQAAYRETERLHNLINQYRK